MIHLAGQSYSAREVIQSIFSPMVGVISSSLADDVCHRNNLSFVELLQPFAKLSNDAHFRDVSGTSVSIRGLRLNFCDVDWRPPQTVLARKMLNEAVTNAQNDKTKLIAVGAVDVEVPTAEPWFERWRETFLTVQFPADHEFTRHFLSCLIVLSSGDPNIVDTAQRLTQRLQQLQNQTPQKLPKWFHPTDVLNSYVVLHEGSQGDLSKAQQGYELLKSTFGDSKCFLIQINSLDGALNADTNDYWLPFIKRQPKTDTQTDQLSAPKTPQDGVSVISMPTMQMSNLSDSGAANETDLAILHPLSPVQENATEAINSKFSISSESIASQTINPNVWAADLEPDMPHGSCLNAMDVENLRHFVQDYAVRALIPYVEHLVAVLTEAITNKKGVSKSLLSATKRWFITSKPGAGVNNQNAVIYTHESAELQTRKLGDLYFMFGHYNLAFQAYHQAKRDFNADSAWQYYAGSLEMAAISAFMLGTANRKTYDYMEDAIVCYLTVCKLQQFATRATLLSMECLKTARYFGETAKQLIRMTSEESDLRSALLLEQAAYCFLACQPSMHRKYAFHIVLAGNRYSRAGQRKHAYRCYRQAFQVFLNRGWSLAEDHIQYTMAKQAYTLKKLEDASQSYAHLLRSGSLQSVQLQASFLKEYIQTQNELIKRNPELGLLPHALPQVLQDSVRVLLSPHTPIANPLYVPASNINIKSDFSDEPLWQKLEEMIATTAAANKPFVFKPSRSLFTKDNPSTEQPIAVEGEPIELAVTLSNTISCSITLSAIDLLWKLRMDNDEVLSNVCLYEQSNESPSKAVVSAAIKTHCTASITLEERAEKTLHFKLTPKVTGHLSIIGIVGQLAATADPTAYLWGALRFEAVRIRATAGKPPPQTLYDNKLSIRIIPPLPCLSVSFTPLPAELIAGEMLPVTISLRNLGIDAIDEVYMACDSPRWITLLDKRAEMPLSILSSMRDLSNEKLVKDKEIRRQHVFRLLRPNSSNAANATAIPVALKPQEHLTVPMWLQSPYRRGDFTLRLLFYYGFTGNAGAQLRYRLVRHHWHFRVHECLRSDVACVVSNTVTGELGLDVRVRNETAPQQSIASELYINSVGLYAAQYKLNPNKLYIINRMEIKSGQLGEHCLKSAKTASFQCRLAKIENNKAISSNNSNTNNTIESAKQQQSLSNSTEALIRSRLSFVDVLPALKDHGERERDKHTPSIDELYCFLLKHETNFFSTNISSEEFNSAVASNQPHITVALNWTAAAAQSPTQQRRIAHGQHFLQLHNLYEQQSCPSEALAQTATTMLTTPFRSQQDHSSTSTSSVSSSSRDNNSNNKECSPIRMISEFVDCQDFAELHANENIDDLDDDAQWEDNDANVAERCIIIDESFVLPVNG